MGIKDRLTELATAKARDLGNRAAQKLLGPAFDGIEGVTVDRDGLHSTSPGVDPSPAAGPAWGGVTQLPARDSSPYATPGASAATPAQYDGWGLFQPENRLTTFGPGESLTLAAGGSIETRLRTIRLRPGSTVRIWNAERDGDSTTTVSADFVEYRQAGIGDWRKAEHVTLSTNGSVDLTPNSPGTPSGDTPPGLGGGVSW